MTNPELRTRLRAERAAITTPMHERAQRLADSVLAHPAMTSLPAGAWVTCYSSYRDEPPTRVLLQRLSDAGFHVIVPAVRGPHLHWHDITGEVDDPSAWTEDSYGIPCPATPEVATSPAELLALGVRVILTPGLGMEKGGARIGQGGGYYDRFFAEVPRFADGGPYRLGITHLGGLLPDGTIEVRSWDQPVDDVIEG